MRKVGVLFCFCAAVTDEVIYRGDLFLAALKAEKSKVKGPICLVDAFLLCHPMGEGRRAKEQV